MASGGGKVEGNSAARPASGILRRGNVGAPARRGTLEAESDQEPALPDRPELIALLRDIRSAVVEAAPERLRRLPAMVASWIEVERRTCIQLYCFNPPPGSSLWVSAPSVGERPGSSWASPFTTILNRRSELRRWSQ
jgi:hypothetical protein